MGYNGWAINDEDRAALLARWPTKFPDVRGHHITHEFGVPEGAELPWKTVGYVTGYACDESLEALVVSIGGITTYRPDNKTYHITWSLDKSKGRKSSDSNVLLENFGLIKPVKPGIVIRLNLEPRYWPDA